VLINLAGTPGDGRSTRAECLAAEAARLAAESKSNA